MHLIIILCDERRAIRPIVGVKKTLAQTIHIEVGVPHQMGQQIGTPLVALGNILVGTLLEHHRDMMVSEILQVRLKNLEIWERVEVVAELHHIIPQEDVVGEGGPSIHIMLKRVLAGFGGDGICALALDGAEHDVHILVGSNVGGCMARLLVGQRGDGLIGKVLGHLVHEPDHRAGWAAI